jgi:hypothetical protein
LYLDQVSSKLIWYILAFLILGGIIFALFFYSYKLYLKNKNRPDAGEEIQPITGFSDGAPQKASS